MRAWIETLPEIILGKYRNNLENVENIVFHIIIMLERRSNNILSNEFYFLEFYAISFTEKWNELPRLSVNYNWAEKDKS